MTIRWTTGLRPTCEHSVAIATTLGYPSGWSLCGIVGLTAMVYPWMGWAASCIDFFMGQDHCYNAVHRSIERAGYAYTVRS